MPIRVWRDAVEDYAPFARPLVEFCWTRRPPLQGDTQIAHFCGIPKQTIGAWLNAAPDARLWPDPMLVRKVARAIGHPVSDLMALAGYGDEADPFMDREEAWHFAHKILMDALEKSPASTQGTLREFLEEVDREAATLLGR